MSQRPAGESTPCPRCGGAPAARRMPTAQNPFLPKSKRLTCSLCGLEYDRDAAPWASGDMGGGEPRG